MAAIPARKYILTIHNPFSIQQSISQPVGHWNEIIIGYLRTVQIDHIITEIAIRSFQNTRFIDPESTINHHDDDISGSLPTLNMLWISHYRGIKFFDVFL